MKTKLLFTFLLTYAMAFAQDPSVFNADFKSLPKAGSTSDCSCSGWVNKDLGDQGESSTEISLDIDAVKFDNFESDIIYQEVAVLSNTNYKLSYSYQFKSPIDIDSQLEIRILKGSGYLTSYTPIYYNVVAEAPDRGYGYTDISEVENALNNIELVVESDPGNTDYIVKDFTFNTGAETSIAIFARGIGRPTTAPSDGKPYTWSSGDHEIRLDYIALTNETTASAKDFLASKLNIFPNPAKDYIDIQSADVKISSAEIFSLLGQKVLSQNMSKNNRIDVSHLSKGIYMLKISSDAGSLTKKIIIE